jgi:endo-1,4-beta-xylanase
MIVKPRVATRRELVASSLAGLGLIHTAGAWAASPGGKLPLAHASAVAPSGRPVPMPDIPFPEDTAPVIDPGGPGLGQIAASHGRVFGAAAQSQLLATDPGYASIFARECGLLTPDYETKWAVLQSAENHFNFAPLDSLLAWARAYSKPVRGTALVWHEGLPDWVAAAMAESPARARALLNNQIGRVLAHTQGSIRDWDVVNEVVADPAGSDTPQSGPGELRDSPFLRALGPDYIALSLQMAKEINPAIRVSLNEYGTEEAAPHHIEKRRRLLNLVRRLRRANVPLDQVGLQGHLQMVQPFSGPPFTAFCRLLRAEGVELVVTEMDIREHWKLPDGLAARDRAVADRVKAFVDAAIDGGIKTFITWGMQDKYSWLATNKYVKRTDGQEHRGLPLDDAGHRKLYWQAMADALGRP